MLALRLVAHSLFDVVQQHKPVTRLFQRLRRRLPVPDAVTPL